MQAVLRNAAKALCSKARVLSRSMQLCNAVLIMAGVVISRSRRVEAKKQNETKKKRFVVWLLLVSFFSVVRWFFVSFHIVFYLVSFS